MRAQRRRDLVRILAEGRARSQQELVDALRAAGHDVTQATVSRDLREVGAAKMPGTGGAVYRLPDAAAQSPNGDLVARSLRRTLDDFALDVGVAGALVVVRTAPGHASAVARAIDLAGIEEVVGTVAGDDTIFVATPGEGAARRLSGAWRGEG